MIKLLLTILILQAVGCVSAPLERTRWTDPARRIMIDPESIDPTNYVKIQRSLMQQGKGKFIVVDRSTGLRAAKREQNAQHINESDRFNNEDKWAHWGKFYGVRGIVVAHIQCVERQSMWGPQRYNDCQQYLSIVDANTAEVIVAVEDTGKTPWALTNQTPTPSWDDIVEEMIDEYPSHFEYDKEHESLKIYRAESKERSIRKQEKE